MPPSHDNSFQLAVDLLQPKISSEKRRHKLKRLVQHPNSFFMDVKALVHYYHRMSFVSLSPSAPAATGSPPSSLTRTLSWSARAAPPCCVTPPGAAPSSQKASTTVTRQADTNNFDFRMCFPKEKLIFNSGGCDEEA